MSDSRPIGLAELGEWLHELLPSYACGYADADRIEWEKLLDNQYMGMYSSGELAALELAAHAGDFSGVLRMLQTRSGARSGGSVVILLAKLSPMQRMTWLAILTHRAMELL